MSDKPGARTLLITDLPPNVEESHLRTLFHELAIGTSTSEWLRTGPKAPGGIIREEQDVLLIHNIANCSIVRSRDTNECVGYGFVEFDTVMNAEFALRKAEEAGGLLKLPGMTHRVRVRWASTQTSFPLEAHQLYVGNLSSDVSDEMVVEFCKSLNPKFAGGVISAKIVKNPVTGAAAGYAFVRVASDLVAFELTESFVKNKIPLGEFPVLVRAVYRRPKPIFDDPEGAEKVSGTTLFCANLSPAISETDLRKLFDAFGHVVSIRVAVMKHIAFITFADQVSALAAITHMSGYMIKGQRLALAFSRNRHSVPFHVKIESVTDHQTVMTEKRYNQEWHDAMTPAPPAPESPKIEMSSDERAKWLQMLVTNLDVGDLTGTPPPPPPSGK